MTYGKLNSKLPHNGSHGGRVGSPAPSLNDVDEESHDNGAHTQRTFEEVLSRRC